MLSATGHLRSVSASKWLIWAGLLAAYNYYKTGALNWKYALIIASAFLIGGYFGSKFTLHIPMIILRKALAVILVLIALRLFMLKQTAKNFLYT